MGSGTVVDVEFQYMKKRQGVFRPVEGFGGMSRGLVCKDDRSVDFSVPSADFKDDDDAAGARLMIYKRGSSLMIHDDMTTGDSHDRTHHFILPFLSLARHCPAKGETVVR